MEKRVVRNAPEQVPEQAPAQLTTEKDIAYDFALRIHRKFDRLIKASILFGSQVKNSAVSGSDIDIILIVDDASINWDAELIAWYREELGKIVSGSKYGDELHINTIKLTTWWQDLMYGDPVIINILRYGEALIDAGGFFNPIKALLLQGKVKSTPEAVYAALQRAPFHIARSKSYVMQSIEGVYWSMVDAAQAALITAGKIPPSPEHIPLLLKQTFVDNKMMKVDGARALRDLYLLHKGMLHGEIKHFKGQEIDAWQERAEKFLAEMTSIVSKLLETQSK